MNAPRLLPLVRRAAELHQVSRPEVLLFFQGAR